MRKYVSEFIGTCILVIFSCGSAVVANTILANAGQAIPLAYSTLLIAFASGLTVIACIYTFGSISGSHINPAVSLAVWMNNKMTTKDFIFYVISQVLGGILGAAILWFILTSNTSLGANGYGTISAMNTTMATAIIVEIILTFVIILTGLTVTSKEETKKSAGFIIGLTVILVHILGIPFTGASVNPARSLGPALLTGGRALSQVWVFILSPLAGSVLASIVYNFIIEDKKEKKDNSDNKNKITKEDKIIKSEKKKSSTKPITKSQKRNR